MTRRISLQTPYLGQDCMQSHVPIQSPALPAPYAPPPPPPLESKSAKKIPIPEIILTQVWSLNHTIAEHFWLESKNKYIKGGKRQLWLSNGIQSFGLWNNPWIIVKPACCVSSCCFTLLKSSNSNQAWPDESSQFCIMQYMVDLKPNCSVISRNRFYDTEHPPYCIQCMYNLVLLWELVSEA